MRKLLVTGCAGFIGFHLTRRLVRMGFNIVGLDNLNEYYDVGLKIARLSELRNSPNFRFEKLDVANSKELARFFDRENFEYVVHLAAQAGVRYSLTNPHAYVEANLVGFANIIEECRRAGVKHLVFASSSSVYGGNTRMPFSVRHRVDHPLSLYAATKRSNELVAHVYAHLYNLPCTGLRFFSVYGPWGRPDMALFIFTKAILEEKHIDVFNFGRMRRDLTYIDDAVECMSRVMERIPRPNPNGNAEQPDCATGVGPYRIFNVASSRPVELMTIISTLEDKLGKKARVNLLPLQSGDVPATFAYVDDLAREIGFKPRTSLEVGIGHFVDWYRDYYQV